MSGQCNKANGGTAITRAPYHAAALLGTEATAAGAVVIGSSVGGAVGGAVQGAGNAYVVEGKIDLGQVAGAAEHGAKWGAVTGVGGAFVRQAAMARAVVTGTGEGQVIGGILPKAVASVASAPIKLIERYLGQDIQQVPPTPPTDQAPAHRTTATGGGN